MIFHANKNNESQQSAQIKSYAEIIKSRSKNKSDSKSKVSYKNNSKTYFKVLTDKNQSIASSRGRNNKSNLDKQTSSLSHGYSERKDNI